MQRLDKREDDPISVGELVTLDNLSGIDNVEGLFEEASQPWWNDYRKMMAKYNPMDKVGRVISYKTHTQLPVRVQWSNGIRNSYYPKNLREV